MIQKERQPHHTLVTMFRKKNRRLSANDSPNAATAARFSLIPALSKLYRSKSSKSASREAFSTGHEEAIQDQPEKGSFFSRLFSGKKDAAVVQSTAPPLQRKPSLWQRSKSFLKPKPVEVEVPEEDSLSTIDLPRARKTQLPKLKIKGSGAGVKVDFTNFVLGKPQFTVDTDVLLQRMFELNEQLYQELRAKHVSIEEATHLSPVMTAVTLSELEKPRAIGLFDESNAENLSIIAVEPLHTEAEHPHYHLEHNNHDFHDDPQLDSPLLSVSGTQELTEDEMSHIIVDTINDSIVDSMNDSIVDSPFEDSEEINSAFDGFDGLAENSSSIEAQSVDSPPSDWSIARLNEEFDVFTVNAPTRYWDGSIHFHFDGRNDDSSESIVFEDWRRAKEEEEQKEEKAAFEQNKSFQSLASFPRASASIEPSFQTRSMSNSFLTGNEQRPALGTRIAQIVAMFERSFQ